MVTQKDVNIFTKHVLMKINNKSFSSLCNFCVLFCMSNFYTLHCSAHMHIHSKIFYGFSHTLRMSISWITKELFLPVWVNQPLGAIFIKNWKCRMHVIPREEQLILFTTVLYNVRNIHEYFTQYSRIHKMHQIHRKGSTTTKPN